MWRDHIESQAVSHIHKLAVLFEIILWLNQPPVPTCNSGGQISDRWTASFRDDFTALLQLGELSQWPSATRLTLAVALFLSLNSRSTEVIKNALRLLFQRKCDVESRTEIAFLAAAFLAVSLGGNFHLKKYHPRLSHHIKHDVKGFLAKWVNLKWDFSQLLKVI